MSAPSSSREPDTHYRLAAAIRWRIIGAQLIAFGMGFLAVLALVVFAAAPVATMAFALLVAFLVISGTAWWLRARASVVTLTSQGYAVGLLRGAGVREASWSQVNEVVTSTPQGVALVVLRLATGAETTIPVAALAVDRETFVRDLQRRLQSGHGLRRLQDPL